MGSEEERMYHGIINVYKEKGYTSFDVVAKLRGILGQKKIGHTGTLDPDAEGVLPVCLGSATKVCDLLTDRDKTYEAVLLLGVETDTQDTSGTILSQKETGHLSEEQVKEAIFSFVGEIAQVPPMYSALKVNGQKLVDLARQGKSIERKARTITIYDITIKSMDLPYVTMVVSCSKGTYIRTLCQDIGQRLGCGGALSYLLRTKAAGYEVEKSLRLDQIEALQDAGTLTAYIRPVEDVFGQYPVVQVAPDAERFLFNGNPLRVQQVQLLSESEDPKALTQAILDAWESAQKVRMRDCTGRFCAIYALDQQKRLLKPVKMFLS